MRFGQRTMSLVPNGFVVESEAYVEDAIHLRVRARADAATCSSCGLPSRRVHSRYVRKVSDLPCSGRAVHLQVLTRRFCCQAPKCAQTHLRRAIRRDRSRCPVSTNHPAGGPRPSSRPCSGRTPGGGFRDAAHDAREQRHASSSGAPPCPSTSGAPGHGGYR